MTSTAVKLPLFENEDVSQAQVRITNAGDGLSDALKIAPVALPLGEEVFYVLRGEVTQINHRRKDHDEPIIRVHTIKAMQITEVDGELAQELLTKAAVALEKAKAEIAGQTSIED